LRLAPRARRHPSAVVKEGRFGDHHVDGRCRACRAFAGSRCKNHLTIAPTPGQPLFFRGLAFALYHMEGQGGVTGRACVSPTAQAAGPVIRKASVRQSRRRRGRGSGNAGGFKMIAAGITLGLRTEARRKGGGRALVGAATRTQVLPACSPFVRQRVRRRLCRSRSREGRRRSGLSGLRMSSNTG